MKTLQFFVGALNVICKSSDVGNMLFAELDRSSLGGVHCVLTQGINHFDGREADYSCMLLNLQNRNRSGSAHRSEFCIGKDSAARPAI